MRLIVAISTVALALAAGAGATTPKGTLTGVVMRGPVVPVCAVEQPCDEPAPHVTLLFSRNAAVVGRTVTDLAGRYRLRLPAGTYTVRRATFSGAVDRKLEPNRVRVYAAHVTKVSFSIDTGIR